MATKKDAKPTKKRNQTAKQLANLKPVQNKKEASERGRKGGIASGVARRNKKTLKEDLEILLARKVTDPKLKKTLARIAGLDEKAVITNQQAVDIALFGALLKGNVKAFEYIQATLEQMPKKEQGQEEQTQRRVEIIYDLPDDKN